MALTTLKDDLMQEFREERVMIKEQLEILDPLGTALRKPAAQRLISSTTLVLTEIVFYLLFVGIIGFAFVIHKFPPFSVIKDINNSPEISSKIGAQQLHDFIWTGYCFLAICAVICFTIGRMARIIRQKNEILYQASKDIKIIIGLHLERKAAIDTIEQRHLLDLSGIAKPNKLKLNINDITNPGYDENEQY